MMSPHEEYVFIIEGNMYIWQQHDSSMIAVELRSTNIYDEVCGGQDT